MLSRSYLLMLRKQTTTRNVMFISLSEGSLQLVSMELFDVLKQYHIGDLPDLIKSRPGLYRPITFKSSHQEVFYFI